MTYNPTFKSMVAIMLIVATNAVAQPLERGPLRGLDIQKNLPSTVGEVVKRANEDCVEIEEYRLPKYAKPEPLEILDGGSRLFFGDGYVIKLKHSLFVPAKSSSDIAGYIYGYELFLVSSTDFAKSNSSPHVSHTWFIDKATMTKIDNANSQELERRLPKDWIREDTGPHSQPGAVGSQN